MAKSATGKKEKFKMPHLMVLILGLLLIMSLLTYVIPAGQFATDPETGALIGSQFNYLGYQTPVSPWQALLFILKGIQNSGLIIATLFAMGGSTEIVLGSKSIEKMVDFAIYRLKDKGIDVLFPILSFIFLLFGAFSGGDYIIAMVPIGLIIAKKLRLDPICGFSLIIVTIMFGQISSPTHVMLPQMMMNVPLYSGFTLRFLLMIPIFIIVILYLYRYAKKVSKDPARSVLGLGEWYEELGTPVEGEVMAAVDFDAKAMLTTILYFLQPIIIVLLTTKFGYGQEVIPAVAIIISFVIGFIQRWSLDQTCNTFAKGVAGMAFISFIIGVANAMSLVMGQGNILHTIVHAFCLPLQQLDAGLAAIGISGVVTLINLLIPSASAKVAILCPIIEPMCNALAVPMQIGVSAFKYGDTITNVISPVQGVLIGGLAVAKVPFNKYLKWIMPLVIILFLYCCATLYFMGMAGWTGV